MYVNKTIKKAQNLKRIAKLVEQKMKENEAAMPLISSILSDVSCIIQDLISQIIQIVQPACWPCF